MIRYGQLAAVLLTIVSCAPDRKPERIVLITVDTLRWDAFHGERACMPRSAEAASAGLVFTNNYAASSSTQPTHATLFTGLHPWQSGVSRNGIVLTEDRVTLAEILAEAGWETAAAVASFPMHRKFGWDQGFDDFYDTFDEGGVSADAWHEVELVDGYYNKGESVTRRALEQIDAARAPRQFFWFHFFDPHTPYGHSTPQPMGLGDIYRAIKGKNPKLTAIINRARKLYDHDVTYLDEEIATVLDRLAAESEEIETHVVLTADHGESFGEDGSLGHGKRLTRGQVHVPLFILSPRVASGSAEEAVGSIDVFPTILGLAGVEPPAGTLGRDLVHDGTADIAFGMRRTFVTPYYELRLDGYTVEAFEPKFFRAQGAEIVIGDHEVLLAESGGVPPDSEGLKRLFASFLHELESGEVQELIDADTQKGLEALGYTR